MAQDCIKCVAAEEDLIRLLYRRLFSFLIAEAFSVEGHYLGTTLQQMHGFPWIDANPLSGFCWLSFLVLQQ